LLHNIYYRHLPSYKLGCETFKQRIGKDL